MDIFRSRSTTSPQETANLGQELGNVLRKKDKGNPSERLGTRRKKGSGWSGATTVCLYGDLGSGKTTFVQGLAKTCGITSRLPSPTFFIVRRYSMPHSVGFFYHMDLYRVMGEKELVELGLPEILADPDSIVLIEWAEKLGSLLPKRRIEIRFSILSDDTHRIAIVKLT
ncbi:MAG: tRNA (adenosine(37)-N6)-threonylcarbamoyltransferase complex ATPase subunit type 1 TsaE [Patescibacteria group bacterium]